MALTPIPTNTKNTVIQATDVNQCVNVLQRSAGQTEVGHYFLQEPAYVTSATCSWYIPSLSRISTPVSVSIDASDQANSGYTNAAASTDHLTASGFHVFNFSNGIQPNPFIGGLYTIQF